MSPYRNPAAVFRRAPRASWWRRHVVAWLHGVPTRLAKRAASRGPVLEILFEHGTGNVFVRTHSAGPG